MRFSRMLTGLIILAIGITLAVGIFTQTTVTENEQVTVKQGILPFTLPGSLFGVPTFGIGAGIALIGLVVLIWGFKSF